jgi:hypothetical protein
MGVAEDLITSLGYPGLLGKDLAWLRSRAVAAILAFLMD